MFNCDDAYTRLIPIVVSAHLALIVIKIDYRNQHAITVSKIYSNVLATNEFQPISVPETALDDKMIGMVFTSYIDQLSTLVYCNFNDSSIHRVSLGIRMGSLPACALRNGHFYIHGQDLNDPCTVVRVHVDPSRPCVSTDHERITIEIPASVPATHLKCIALGDPRLIPPKYGVLLVTRRTFETLPSVHTPFQRIRSVQFWPTSDTGTRLEFGDLAFYEHPFEMTGLVVGISGRYGALIDMRRGAFRPKACLGLVHYAAHPTPSTSFHELDTASIQINYYTAVIALDDALGVVYVMHVGEGTAATLSVLSYA
jgi:hypothetical protein